MRSTLASKTINTIQTKNSETCQSYTLCI